MNFSFPPLSPHGPGLGNLLELPPQIIDARTDKAAIRLQLGFPRPPQSDSAPDSGKVAPHPFEAGKEVLQLGQLHLELGLPGSGSCGEDVQDQLRAIHHPDPEKIFQVLPLGR